MLDKIKILAFSGSLKAGSYNKRILKIAGRGAEKAGAEVTYIDLNAYPIPIYNSDEHEKNGYDKNALKLQGLLTKYDGFLIATPEYNGSLPVALSGL
jgi:chromate reductase